MTRRSGAGGAVAVFAAAILSATAPGDAQERLLQFAAPATFEMSGSQLKGIVIGDFNSDGSLDIAVTSSVADQTNGVTVLFGDGQGRFAEGESFFAPKAWAIATEDLNGEDILDLVAGTRVYLGNVAGDGTFGPARPVPGTTALSGTAPDLVGRCPGSRG